MGAWYAWRSWGSQQRAPLPKWRINSYWNKQIWTDISCTILNILKSTYYNLGWIVKRRKVGMNIHNKSSVLVMCREHGERERALVCACLVAVFFSARTRNWACIVAVPFEARVLVGESACFLGFFTKLLFLFVFFSGSSLLSLGDSVIRNQDLVASSAKSSPSSKYKY